MRLSALSAPSDRRIAARTVLTAPVPTDVHRLVRIPLVWLIGMALGWAAEVHEAEASSAAHAAAVAMAGPAATAVPQAGTVPGLYERDGKLARTVTGLLKEADAPRLVQANRAIAEAGPTDDPAKAIESIVSRFRGADLPKALRGAGFSTVPAGMRLVVYQRIEVTAAASASLRVCTAGAASVTLDGRSLWSRVAGGGASSAADDAILLPLHAGANHLVIEAGPTSALGILTTRAAQRVGGFLVPLMAADPAALAWFDPWLEAAETVPAGDALATMLREVGAAALRELRVRGEPEAAWRAQSTALAGDAPIEAQATATLQVAVRRRALRLAELRAQAPAIAFAAHRDYRPSFFAYTEGLSDARAERHFLPGSSLDLLDLSGAEPARRALIDDAYGMLRDPDVSYDGKSLLFAWKKSDRNDDFQLHEMDLASGAVRQITYGLGTANIEGAYLPDGAIVFASTRDEHSVPCWRTEVTNLYKINRDGSFLRRLAVDQVHTLYPKPTDDGRITYTRWDYSDRGQVYPHPLFQMNIDGTMQAALHGANSWFPTSRLHARQIPGTPRFLAIAAGHHTPQSGKVIELDPDGGRDEGKGVAFIAPRRDKAYERVDGAMQDGGQFAHPFPLRGETFLAAHLPAARVLRRFDLYWFGYDGSRELLWSEPDDRSSLYPVAVRPRPLGHPRPERVDYTRSDAVIYIEDVYKGPGLANVPRGTADRLRVVEVRYRSASVGAGIGNNGPGGGSSNGTPIAVAGGSWDVKAIVGETPIRPDGSVLVRVPAMKSLYYQVIDHQGHVIQTMRSWDTNRPGEFKSCVGCHSYADNAAPSLPSADAPWTSRAPAELTTFAASGWNGFSFPKHVQPILDRNCLSCHDGKDPQRIDLRGDVGDPDAPIGRTWSRAYTQLTAAVKRKDASFGGNPDGKWVKWIDKMSIPTPLPAYSAGAATSPLLAMLRDGHHGVTLSAADYGTIAAWIDLLVPFAGDYHEATMWNEKDQGYYGYYEDKRRINKLEEGDEIARFLASRDAGKADKTAGRNGQPSASDLPEVTVTLAGATPFTTRLSPRQLAIGSVSVTLPGPLRPGTTLTLSGARSLLVQLGELPEAELFLPSGTFAWTLDAAVAKTCPPTLLTAQAVTLRIRVLRDEERGAYRNLARNPLSPAVEAGTVPACFPVAQATSETRGDPLFRARCAIDGYEANSRGHSSFPHQAWGPDQQDRPAITVRFGRPVRIDRVDLLLRADFPHDRTWKRGEILVDGKRVANIDLVRTADAQTATFAPVVGDTVEVRNLEWSEPGWCALSELRVWGLDADRTPDARITAAAAAGTLTQVPLQ